MLFNNLDILFEFREKRNKHSHNTTKIFELNVAFDHKNNRYIFMLYDIFKCWSHYTINIYMESNMYDHYNSFYDECVDNFDIILHNVLPIMIFHYNNKMFCVSTRCNNNVMDFLSLGKLIKETIFMNNLRFNECYSYKIILNHKCVRCEIKK